MRGMVSRIERNWLARGRGRIPFCVTGIHVDLGRERRGAKARMFVVDAG